MARVSLQEYCDEARELIDRRQYAAAIAICRHILKRYPRHIRTYQILGEACLENGELDEAIDIFKRLLANADPENLTAYAGLGVAYQQQGQLAEAIWYMERAFELAPNNEETRSSLRQLYFLRDGVEPARIRHSKAALARLYARGGQYRQAIEEFRLLLQMEENRNRMDLKVSLAETLWRDGRREQASELAREILQAAPDCLKAMLLLGKITIEKGRHEEGQAILAQTRGLDPENRMAQALFGAMSPLPPQVVLIPRMEPPPEPAAAPVTPAEAVVEPGPAEVAPVAEAVEAEAAAPEAVEAAEVPVAPLEEERITAAEPPPAEAPPAIAEEAEAVAVAEAPPGMEGMVEEAGTSAVEATELSIEEEVAAAPVAEPTEAAAPPEEEEAVAAEVQVVAPTEAQAGEMPPAEEEPGAAAVAEETVPKTKRGQRAAPQPVAMEAVEGAAAGPLSDVERYRLLVEQKPKDDELRLALARALRDGSQIKLALEQYAVLVRAKPKLLPEIIADVEGIVASRPDNLEAHELLADLYGRNGQLQKALERYRWVLERLREGN